MSSAVRAMTFVSAVLQLRLGDDLDFVGQARPQCAQGDGLIRTPGCRSAPPGRRTPAIGARRAVPLAILQALPSLLHGAILGQRNALGQRPPCLVNTVSSKGAGALRAFSRRSSGSPPALASAINQVAAAARSSILRSGEGSTYFLRRMLKASAMVQTD